MGIEPTFFAIHPSSGVPIYRQLIDQVQAMVAGGRLQPGEVLPSVRVMAQSLAVNPMTVSKAYGRLEQEGVLERRRGRGMVVAERDQAGTEAELQARKNEIVPLVEQAVIRARQLNLTDPQIKAMVNSLLKKHTRKESNRG